MFHSLLVRVGLELKRTSNSPIVRITAIFRQGLPLLLEKRTIVPTGTTSTPPLRSIPYDGENIKTHHGCSVQGCNFTAVDAPASSKEGCNVESTRYHVVWWNVQNTYSRYIGCECIASDSGLPTCGP